MSCLASSPIDHYLNSRMTRSRAILSMPPSMDVHLWPSPSICAGRQQSGQHRSAPGPARHACSTKQAPRHPAHQLVHAAGGLPGPDKDDGLTQALALGEDHVPQDLDLVVRGRAVLLVVFQGGFNARSIQPALTVEET